MLRGRRLAHCSVKVRVRTRIRVGVRVRARARAKVRRISNVFPRVRTLYDFGVTEHQYPYVSVM